jgi:hypothetical protein
MDLLYMKLNRKLDALTQHARIDNKTKEYTNGKQQGHKYIQ